MGTVCLNRLAKRFGALEVVHNIDLVVEDREFVALVGPSGCGKSTTLRMIAGLENISSGTVEIDGRPVNDLTPRQRNVAMVFQSYALYPHMTVRQNMGFSMRLQKLAKSEIEKKVMEAARILQLEQLLDRRPSELSGGQRQRVAMGRAIVRNPSVFLFDEPLSNLDAKLRAEMRAEIKRLHATVSSTMVYVTHDQIEAMTLADRIVIMRDGNIEQIGAPEDVFSMPDTLFVAGFIGSPAMNLLVGEVADGMVKLQGGDTLPLPQRFSGAVETGRKVVVGIRPDDVFPRDHGLVAKLAEERVVTISMSEPLGNETLVFFRFGGRECVSRMLKPFPIRIGTEMTMVFDLERLHLFDAETEQAIHP